MTYNKKIVLAFFKEMGIPEPELEYEFHPERKWRFDFAWPTYYFTKIPHHCAEWPKLYLEVDGGIWIKGGHNRGAQMKKDWEKRNCASELGWRGIWVEPKDLCTVTTAELIKRCLGLV